MGKLALYDSIMAQTQLKQRQRRQAHYRDMKEMPTRTWNDVDPSLDGRDEGMVT